MELSVGYLKDVGESHAAVRLRAAGIEPRCVALPPRLGLAAFRCVRRHLAQVRPELVHTQLGYADLLGGPAARSLGLPTVATIHSHAPPSTARDRVKARMMTAARSASAARVIAVSESARAAYLAAGAASERVVVVHNGIVGRAEPGAGARVRSDLGLGVDDLVAVMVSSLRPEKGHDVALDTVRASLERFPSLRLVVAGDGPLRPWLERAAATLGDRVVLASYRPDILAVLDAADVLVQPCAPTPSQLRSSKLWQRRFPSSPLTWLDRRARPRRSDRNARRRASSCGGLRRRIGSRARGPWAATTPG